MTLHSCPVFCIYWVDEPGKLIFSKLFCIIDVNAQFLLTEMESLMSFPQQKKKERRTITIQQQYICKFSTSNFKCHSCTCLNELVL